MNSPETPEPKSSIAERHQLESAEKIPIKINDLRDPASRSFDLEKFLKVIERLRREGLFKITREFEDSEYGKYMSIFASSESDHWDEAIQSAKAIEITLTTPPNRGLPGLTGNAKVEVKILMDEKEGRVFVFRFNGDGTYRGGGWDDVHLQKRLGQGDEPNDFELMVDPEPKKLE